MNTEESFDNSTYADEMHVEESELSAFVNAVKEMFGSEQARKCLVPSRPGSQQGTGSTSRS